MHESVQLRWIAEAEARSVREFARVQRAESEPCGSVAYTGRTRPTWFDRLRRLVPGAAGTIARARSFPVDTTVRVKAHSGAALSNPSTEVGSDRVLVTVLITDIVDSTRHVAEMGDRHWRALLDRHDAMVRQQFNRFRGREIKHTGDGFLATFDGPARAVHCASAIAGTVQPIGIELRAGLHTGEIELKGDDIVGIAVNIAARVAAMAGPNETLVSSTVRDLVVGSGLRFDDRGFHKLKGLPERVHLFRAL